MTLELSLEHPDLQPQQESVFGAKLHEIAFNLSPLDWFDGLVYSHQFLVLLVLDNEPRVFIMIGPTFSNALQLIQFDPTCLKSINNLDQPLRLRPMLHLNEQTLFLLLAQLQYISCNSVSDLKLQY